MINFSSYLRLASFKEGILWWKVELRKRVALVTQSWVGYWDERPGPPDCGEVWGDRQEGSHLGRCEIWKAVGRTDGNLELIFTFAQSLSRLLKMLKIQWEEAIILRQMATYNVSYKKQAKRKLNPLARPIALNISRDLGWENKLFPILPLSLRIFFLSSPHLTSIGAGFSIYKWGPREMPRKATYS